jgi:hypothetical protein
LWKVEEVLYRKLSVVLMASALEDFDIRVANVIHRLLEERFQKVFTHIIMPIGVQDPNREIFEKVLLK